LPVEAGLPVKAALGAQVHLLKGVRWRMSRDGAGNGREQEAQAIEAVPLVDGRVWNSRVLAEPDRRPRLCVRHIERTALVRLMDAEILSEESAERAVGVQLNRLVEQGHTRVLLNLGGVRYMSCALLGRLVGLQKRLDVGGGRIQLCGLDPLLQDMLRICHLDRVFDSYTDEAEALGLLLR
jgi:anti-anti-sigma factor